MGIETRQNKDKNRKYNQIKNNSYRLEAGKIKWSITLPDSYGRNKKVLNYESV